MLVWIAVHILTTKILSFNKTYFCIRVSFLHFLLWQTLTVAGHYTRWDNVLQLCSVEKQLFFFFFSTWLRMRKQKMAKAWELGGREMLFLWEQAKDLCLCLFRWHHLPTILYTRYPAVLSPRPLVCYWPNTESMIGLKFHWNGMLRDEPSNLGAGEFLNCYCAKGHPPVQLCLYLPSSTAFGLWG